MFHHYWGFLTYQSTKGLLKNFSRRSNIKEKLLEITRGCLYLFQPQDKDLNSITMSITFLIRSLLLQLWLIKLYAAFLVRRLMIVKLNFLDWWLIWSQARPLKRDCRTLIPQIWIILRITGTQMFWEWTSCANSKNSKFKGILTTVHSLLNWLHDWKKHLTSKYLIWINN